MSWKLSPGGTLMVSTIVRYTMAPIFCPAPAAFPCISDTRASGMGISRSEGVCYGWLV
jgi:hypothetical protein